MRKLIDPVCGMVVDESSLRADGYEGVAFCSETCRDTFVAATSTIGVWEARSGVWSEADHPAAPQGGDGGEAVGGKGHY